MEPHWPEVSDPSQVVSWSARPVAKGHPDDIRALFVQGPPWRGRPTRAYAAMAVPSPTRGDKVPGMVLIHGGGGSAFYEWVALWAQRGYAAIAIDMCGATPGPDGLHGSDRPRHEHGGPPGWNESFKQTGEPITDQWAYHAVALASIGRRLLAQQPGVDGGRIGVTGISWGGYLTCLVASADPGFACAIPVYGSGFLWEDSVWRYDSVLSTLPAHERHRWVELWDPGSWLHKPRMPMLFVNGTNDFAYFMNSMRRSYRTVKAPKTLCVPVELKHSHPDGWAPREIGLFADAVLTGADPLAVVTSHGVEGGDLRCTFHSVRPIVKAELNFTRATGYWPDRKWNILPARLDASGGAARAQIPTQTTACFMNLIDDRGAIVSTEHVEVFTGA